MARKWLTPVSIIVFVLGIAMVVWSLARDGDSASTQPSELTETSVGQSTDQAASNIDPSGSGVSDSTPSASGEASDGSADAPGAGTTVTTGAPGSSPTPTSAVPSVTVRPLSPGVSAAVTTTVAPLSIPPLVIAPGVVLPPACVSFADCAQKLFSEWLSGGSGARTRAESYGTPEAVSALFGIRTIGVVWNPTVYRSTALKYVAAATSHPKGIEFNFTSGQTGFKVQSVTWY